MGGSAATMQIPMKKGVYTHVGCTNWYRNAYFKHFYLKVTKQNRVTISMVEGSYSSQYQGDCKKDPAVANGKGVKLIHEYANSKCTRQVSKCSRNMRTSMVNVDLGVTAGQCVDKCKMIPAAFAKKLTAMGVTPTHRRRNVAGPGVGKGESKSGNLRKAAPVPWRRGVIKTKKIFCS